MQNTTIAVDGSLYRFHPKFKKNMEKTMQILVNPHIRVSVSYLNLSIKIECIIYIIQCCFYCFYLLSFNLSFIIFIFIF